MGDCLYTVALEVINTSLQDKPALEDADKTHATTQVAKIIYNYYVIITCNNKLFNNFKVDFKDQTKDMFLKVKQNTLKALKTVLQYKRIYTGNNCARVVNSVYKTLAIDNSPKQDPTEF